ncbi:MAG: hypothetical protein ACM3UW_07270, partial [Bacillota bacterium]
TCSHDKRGDYVNLNLLARRAFETTDTELKAIAAPAIIRFNNMRHNSHLQHAVLSSAQEPNNPGFQSCLLYPAA